MIENKTILICHTRDTNKPDNDTRGTDTYDTDLPNTKYSLLQELWTLISSSKSYLLGFSTVLNKMEISNLYRTTMGGGT
jgi:hypothetical protein